MKIKEPKASFTDETGVISALELLLKQPTMHELRPCQNCVKKCSCTGSTSCACQCSAECGNIPIALSVEPDRYPVENGVAKLVFEFNTLRLFETCWSCEGHQNSGGTVSKLPRIWFYTSSTTYSQLVAQHLSSLMCRHQLQYQWGIQIISLSDEVHSTYSMEPILEQTTQLDIETLHNDLKVISKDFGNNIKRVAKGHLQRLNKKRTINRCVDSTGYRQLA